MKIINIKDVFGSILLIVSTMITAFVELILKWSHNRWRSVHIYFEELRRTLCLSGLVSIRKWRNLSVNSLLYRNFCLAHISWYPLYQNMELHFMSFRLFSAHMHECDLTLWFVDQHYAAQQRREGQSEESGVGVAVSSQKLREEHHDRC